MAENLKVNNKDLVLLPRDPWESRGAFLTDFVCTFLGENEKPRLCSVSLLSWVRITEKIQLVPQTALHKYLHLCDL